MVLPVAKVLNKFHQCCRHAEHPIEHPAQVRRVRKPGVVRSNREGNPGGDLPHLSM
jgi:hypothetical protein